MRDKTIENIWHTAWSKELGYYTKCFYCERPIGDNHPLKKTKEHILPKSKGGHKAQAINCVPSCVECNTLKGSLELPDFKDKLQAISQSHLPIPLIIANIEKLIEIVTPICNTLYNKKYVEFNSRPK